MSEMNENKNLDLNMISDWDPTVQKKTIVNCPKCNASLQVRNPDSAYMCPVCGEILRVRIRQVWTKEIEEITSILKLQNPWQIFFAT